MTEYTAHTRTTDNGGGSFTRGVQNHIGRQYKGVWSAAESVLEAGADPGDIGAPENFSFGEQSFRGPLQSFLKDDGDAINATRTHVRRSDAPAQWFELAANRGGPNFVDGVAPVVTRADRRIRFPQIWDNGAGPTRKASLNWLTQGHSLSGRIRVNENAPTSYQFRLRLPVGWSFDIGPLGGGRIKNGAGNVRFRFRAPFAWDSGGRGSVFRPDPIMGQVFAAQYTIDQVLEVGGHPVYLFSKSITESIAGATFPVYLDPTATASGTSDLEDTFIDERAAQQHVNYGSNVLLAAGTPFAGLEQINTLFRVAGSAIPANVTAVRWKAYRDPDPSSSQAGTLNFHKILKAWTEAGADWVDAVHTSLAWETPGAAGSSDRNASEASQAYPADTAGAPFAFPDANGIALPASWAVEGVDMLFYIKEQTPDTQGKYVVFQSTETAGTPPVVEMDYTVGPSGHSWYYNQMGMQ